MNSFVKQFIATVKGDTTEAQAQKSWRSAESALKTQIASKEGDTISFEDRVEIAKENLNMARINGGVPIDAQHRAAYISNLFDAKNDLTDAEYELKMHLEEIAFLKEEYANLQKED